MRPTNLLHANHNATEIAVARKKDERRVCFAGVDGGCRGGVTLLIDTVGIRRVRFRAGQLF